MPTALANFIRQWVKSRGMTLTELAVDADIPKTTLSNILNKPHQMPDILTLVKLAPALQTDLRTLLELCGIRVEVAASRDAERQKLGVMLEAIPWLRDLIGPLATLPPEDQAGVVGYLQWVVDKRQHPRKG